MDFVRKHANSIRLAVGTPGSNRSEGADEDRKKKDCESPSSVAASRSDGKWFAVGLRGSRNQAVHNTAEAAARPRAPAAAAAAAAPERQSTAGGRGAGEWGAATTKERADSRSHKGRWALSSGSERLPAVGSQGMPAVVVTRPSSSSGADSCGGEAIWVAGAAEACKGGNCSVGRGGGEWLLVEKHTPRPRTGGDASGSKKWQYLKGKEMAPASDRCSGGSGGRSSSEKRPDLDASRGSKSWHGVGASGGGSLQPVGSSSGAGERLPSADDDGGSSSGDESWTTAHSTQSWKSDTESAAKPRNQPERGPRPAAASAATGPPGELPRAAANKAVKTTRLMVGKARPKSNSGVGSALALQREKSRGRKQAGQARAGSNVRRTPGDYPEDELLAALD